MEALKLLWGVVLTLGMVGIMGGMFVLLLDRMAAVSGLGATTVETLNNVTAGIKSIFTDWYSIIIVIAVIVIILFLLVGVFRLFGGGIGGRN